MRQVTVCKIIPQPRLDLTLTTPSPGGGQPEHTTNSAVPWLHREGKNVQTAGKIKKVVDRLAKLIVSPPSRW